MKRILSGIVLFVLVMTEAALGGDCITIHSRRPAIDDSTVPVNTSFYVELSAQLEFVCPQCKNRYYNSVAINPCPFCGSDKNPQTITHKIDKNSVTVQIQGNNQTITAINAGNFIPPYIGRTGYWNDYYHPRVQFFYAELDKQNDTEANWLAPNTTYTINVSASLENGRLLPAPANTYSFTTGALAQEPHAISFDMNLQANFIQWKGAFFNGFQQCSFNSTELYDNLPSWNLMNSVRNGQNVDNRPYPKAWSLQHDDRAFMQDVLEKETRHIKKMQTNTLNINEIVIEVEDYFGYWQYKNADGQEIVATGPDNPLSMHYKPGDLVLITDNQGAWAGTLARTRVASINDEEKKIIVVKNYTDYDTGQVWQLNLSASWINYSNADLIAKYPDCDPINNPQTCQGDPRDPGVFPPQKGIYLRKMGHRV